MKEEGQEEMADSCSCCLLLLWLWCCDGGLARALALVVVVVVVGLVVVVAAAGLHQLAASGVGLQLVCPDPIAAAVPLHTAQHHVEALHS